MKVEAAVVTQKRQNNAFNTDSVNINGKILSREVIENGYKGTGIMNGTVYFAVSCSEIEGFADAAVAAFNERSESFKEEGVNPSDVITGYFKDSVYALGEMGHRSSELASAILYASAGTVLVAKTGDASLYTYAKSGLVKVTPALFVNEDGSSQYGICTFPSVAVDDIFLLLSPGVSQVLTDKDLEDICKAAEGSVKKIVNLISKVASVKEGSGAVSAIAVKVTEADDQQNAPVFGFVPQKTGNDDPAASGDVPVAPVDEGLTNPKDAPKKKTNKLLLAVLIAAVIIVLLGIAALALKMFGGNLGGLFNKEKETTTVITTTQIETTTKAVETTTKTAVTTTNPVTTTMAVTTTVAPTTAAQSTSTRPSSTSSYVDDDEDEDEEEEGTTAEEEEEDTEPSTDALTIPSELSQIVTEAPSTDPTSSNVDNPSEEEFF